MTLLLDRPRSRTPDIHDDATRREFIVGGVAAGLLAVAGCGRNEDTGSASPATTQGNDAFPVTVEHRYGNTEIPAEPKRVVTVGLIDHDPVLALGMVPVGLTAGAYATDTLPYGVWPWAQDALGDGRPEVLPDAEVNFEQIAALRPDLILAVYSGITDQEYEKLAQIAPTVAQSSEHPDYGAPWSEMTLVIGRSLGREDRAQELVEQVEERFANAREQHPEFKGKAAVYAGALAAGGYYAETEGSSRVGVLTSLGFTIPADLESDRFYVEINQEQLDLFDRDVLVWEIGDAPDVRSSIESDPLYQQLDVSKEGRDVFIMDQVLAAGMAFISVLSLPFVIDQLVPKLAAALDGDPATVAPDGARAVR